MLDSPRLLGRVVRLEPLTLDHVPGLVAAAAADPGLYRWSPVPQGTAAATTYVNTALTWARAGTAVPFAIVRAADGLIVGSTRFWNLERWAWPPAQERHGRTFPDACEIGYSWLSKAAVRTAANTEAKLLLLTHAFETWHVLRVCFHADERNARSREALERIGARYEGMLRAHRLAVDGGARNSARFSIIASEWPVVRERLESRLDGRR